jgi:stress-induced morphogen
MTVQQEIEQRLQNSFSPEFLDVANESHQHSVPPNSETHFKVVLVSAKFAGSSRVSRHQQVYATLASQMEGPVHALALHTFSPDEWQQRGEQVQASPECKGGSKADNG